MPYWILENGKPVGPLRIVDVLQRATPETLVSHDQAWVRLDQHPDLAPLVDHGTIPLQPMDEPFRGRDHLPTKSERGRDEEIDQAKRDSEYWVLLPGATSPKGPFSREEVEGLRRPDLKVMYGERWLRLGDHPDFSRSAGPGAGHLATAQSKEAKAQPSVEATEETPHAQPLLIPCEDPSVGLLRGLIPTLRMLAFRPRLAFERLQNSQSILAPVVYSLAIISLIVAAFWIAATLFWSAFSGAMLYGITGGDPFVTHLVQGIIQEAERDTDLRYVVEAYRAIPGFMVGIFLFVALVYMLLNLFRTLLSHVFLAWFGSGREGLLTTFRVTLYSTTPNILALLFLSVVVLELLRFQVLGSTGETIARPSMVIVLFGGWFAWTFFLETNGFAHAHGINRTKATLAVAAPYLVFFVGAIYGVVFSISLLSGFSGDSSSSHHQSRRADPGLTTLRLVIARHPNLEETSVNKRAHTVTIRNRETGEEMTVNYRDVEQGIVDLEAMTNPGSPKVHNLQPLAVDTNSHSYSDAFPSWVPLYPGCEPKNPLTKVTDEEQTGGFELQTEDSVAEVIEYYRTALENQGYKVSVNTFDQDDSEGGMVNGTLEDDGRNVVAILNSERRGPTKVVVSFRQPRQGVAVGVQRHPRDRRVQRKNAIEIQAPADSHGASREVNRLQGSSSSGANALVQSGLTAEDKGDYDEAVRRYKQALESESHHPVANRRLALLMSRRTGDPFLEARYLLEYIRFADENAFDRGEVKARLEALKGGWGHEARRACVKYDQARMDLAQWVAMNQAVHREAVSQNIATCEASKRNAQEELRALNARLIEINLDVQTLMMDSADDADYWKMRKRQVASLRTQISQTEDRLRYSIEQPERNALRTRIDQYSKILSEIEDEARKVGVTL